VDLQQLMAEPLDFQMRMEQAARRGPLEFDWYGFEGAFQQFPGGQVGGAGFPGTGLRRAMGDGGGQLGHLHQG
jgi:hypothetical protein